MGTEYYAIPKKVVMVAAMKELFNKTPKSLLEDALKLMNEDIDESTEEQIEETYKEICMDIVEIGTVSFSNPKGETNPRIVFSKNNAVSEKKLDEILKNPDYIITDKYSEFYETAEFKAKIENEWK